MSNLVEEKKEVLSTRFKVFAILSYIGNFLWLFLSLIILLVNPDTLGLDFSLEDEPEVLYGGIAMIILCLFSLIGLFLMHIKRKRAGFYVYIVGSGPFIFTGFGLISILFIYIFYKDFYKVNV